MYGIKFDYRPDRSRQEAIVERMRKAIRREALKELAKKEKEKKNANS